MRYRTELLLRLLALAGMLTFAVSNGGGWTYGALIGVLVWVFLLPFTASRFVGRLVPTDLRGLWKPIRPREARVPRLAIAFAKRLGARPPKVMKVQPGSDFNASVNGKTLCVTEGLRAGMWTRTAEGIMAHEMAHLAGKHSLKMTAMVYCAISLIIVTIALIGETSWGIVLAVALTIVPVFFPLLSRHLEYDADKRAATLVGSEEMAHALRTVVDRPQWGVESESHPSIEKRLARLRKRDP